MIGAWQGNVEYGLIGNTSNRHGLIVLQVKRQRPLRLVGDTLDDEVCRIKAPGIAQIAIGGGFARVASSQSIGRQKEVKNGKWLFSLPDRGERDLSPQRA
jgi:hypothetical protein